MMLIKNEKFKQTILAALADVDIVNILNFTRDNPKSVNDIINEFDVSHSTAYRKVKWMLEMKLLLPEKIQFTGDGKKFSLLKSTICSVNVRYQNDKIIIEVVKNGKPIVREDNSFGKKKLEKIMVGITIELALLKISSECLQKVTEILRTDYNCSISDCYENPEYLDRILKDLYGNASNAVTDHIKNSLADYVEEEKTSHFLKVLCK